MFSQAGEVAATRDGDTHQGFRAGGTDNSTRGTREALGWDALAVPMAPGGTPGGIRHS